MSPYYQDDLVTLYLGDCHEETAWTRADVLVTDPPYGVNWKQRLGDARQVRLQTHLRDVVQGDTNPDARDHALALWGLKPAIVFGSWRVPRPPNVRSLLIWHKEGAYSGPLNAAFFTNHEDIYVIGEGWRKSAPPLRSVITTKEHRSSASREAGHPTPKPVGLMEALIDRCPAGGQASGHGPEAVREHLPLLDRTHRPEEDPVTAADESDDRVTVTLHSDLTGYNLAVERAIQRMRTRGATTGHRQAAEQAPAIRSSTRRNFEETP